jgi:hypothetical protein
MTYSDHTIFLHLIDPLPKDHGAYDIVLVLGSQVWAAGRMSPQSAGWARILSDEPACEARSRAACKKVHAKGTEMWIIKFSRIYFTHIITVHDQAKKQLAVP